MASSFTTTREIGRSVLESGGRGPEELLNIVDIINGSPKTPTTLGNGHPGFIYRETINGERFTVLTESKGGKEFFNNYYTNRKASARLIVKQYENRGSVLDDFQLYDLGTKQEKTGNQTQGTGTKALTPLQSPVSRYKVKDLIHSTKEEDQKILGISKNSTRFSPREYYDARDAEYAEAVERGDTEKNSALARYRDFGDCLGIW
ncbi:MAG: hypothetical protein J6X70_05225 [Muribaculaceae bacterium]|nr:hypothetical protein [Muribaculaceae bacterium]